jgi:hypothetical protein
MKNLSPAAQKILRADAAERCLAEWSSVNDPPCHPSDEGWHGCGTCINQDAVAAALEAFASTMKMDRPLGGTDADAGVFAAHHAIRSEILAIANELKAD